MHNKCCFTSEIASAMRTWLACSIPVVLAMVLFAVPASAVIFEVGGKPLFVNGYINQGVSFGLGDKEDYDTQDGIQQAITQLLVETEYVPDPDFKIFVSGSLNVDWAYEILDSDDDWKEKGFDESDDLFFLDDYEDILKEAHVTWGPGDFLFRIGKQIVSWGETDGIRVMDQINPQDRRRGAGTDVEFETTIIPIWLIKAEYFLSTTPTWMYDFGLELVFNPNADFIPDKIFSTGNDEWGIWAPYFEQPGFGSAPPGYVGSSVNDVIEEPDRWDSDAHEIGVRLKANILNTLITLNYFDGVANSPVKSRKPMVPDFEQPGYQGNSIMHLEWEGYYPDFKMAGITLTRDFEKLNLKFLGGVAPVLRLEVVSGIDNTYESNAYNAPLSRYLFDKYEKYDDLRYAIGLDWKIKIPFLNPRAYFRLSPQYIVRHISDYPSDDAHYLSEGGREVAEDTDTVTLLIMTSYMHNKINPMLYFQRDKGRRVSDGKEMPSDLFKASVTYEYSDKWNYTLGYTSFSNEGYRKATGLSHKDNISFTASYRF